MSTTVPDAGAPAIVIAPLTWYPLVLPLFAGLPPHAGSRAPTNTIERSIHFLITPPLSTTPPASIR